mmetsp:Transcript_28321/g.88073  ORF Transcript_28321/g.88073 Transcript_28321/m.88073 type:complete len:332 (-) Transcript_28321:165-1160(-)
MGSDFSYEHDREKEQEELVEEELPPFLFLVGAGLTEVNGRYELCRSKPGGPYQGKASVKYYHWAKVDNPSTIVWYEDYDPFSWCLSVNGDGFYMSGGDGAIPYSFTKTRREIYGDPSPKAHALPLPQILGLPQRPEDEASEDELPPCLWVLGAGLPEVNGRYELRMSKPEGHYLGKTSVKDYHWAKSDDATIIVWFEDYSPHAWGLSVKGDGVYLSGGDGAIPSAFARTRQEVYHDHDPNGNKLPLPDLRSRPRVIFASAEQAEAAIDIKCAGMSGDILRCISVDADQPLKELVERARDIPVRIVLSNGCLAEDLLEASPDANASHLLTLA